MRAEVVHHAGGQRLLRTDHGQRNALGQRHVKPGDFFFARFRIGPVELIGREFNIRAQVQHALGLNVAELIRESNGIHAQKHHGRQ